ncbi:hypothetical protein KV22_23505 [Enterobacter hormaechei subsp. xiangfangensis]|nr:hypothetical protein KV22_23505 [Enterobacter hormaechei subsp. xiangfangensis]
MPLKGNPKSVMFPPALINKNKIAFIKMKIPGQLNLVRLGGIPSVVFGLFTGQKTVTHPASFRKGIALLKF